MNTIRKNTATDVNDVEHTITWSGEAVHGQRTRALVATCDCGWKSDTGSEAACRRDFTFHITGKRP